MKKRGEKLQKNKYIYIYIRGSVMCAFEKGGRSIFWPFMFLPKFRTLQH